MRSIIYTSLCCGTLVGCAHLTPTQPELNQAYETASFIAQTPEAVLANRWWLQFGSAELNALMESAFSENLGLAQASARLRQKAALARKAGADRRPTLDASASAGSTYYSESDQVDAYSLGLDFSYEIDIWGRIKSEQQAALLEEQATAFDYEAVLMVLAGNIADAWLDIGEQVQKLELIEEQLQANTDYLDLLKLRQRKSLATALDVFQQQQSVENTAALVPVAEQALMDARLALAVLLGTAEVDASIEGGRDLKVDGVIAAGIPSSLLESRPDLKAAQQRLFAQNESVAVARIARLPQLKLTGSVATSDEEISELFGSWLANLAANLTAPLIDGGSLKADVEIAEAELDEEIALYKETVIAAIHEVNGALNDEIQSSEKLLINERQLAASVSTLDEANRQYRKGISTYLNVLTALSTKQSLARATIETQYERYGARIALYRALGGNWMEPTLNEKEQANEH